MITKAEVPEFINIRLYVSNLLKSGDNRYTHQDENVEKIENGIKFVTITTKIDDINVIIKWYLRCNGWILEEGTNTIEKE